MCIIVLTIEFGQNQNGHQMGIFGLFGHGIAEHRICIKFIKYLLDSFYQMS